LVSRFDLIFPLATAARHDDQHRREKARRENPALLKRLDQLEAEKAGFKREITSIPPDAVGEVVRLPDRTEIDLREVEALEAALQDPGIRHEALRSCAR
jgi:hypothetical protein